jgi:hypothetical protein
MPAFAIGTVRNSTCPKTGVRLTGKPPKFLGFIYAPAARFVAVDHDHIVLGIDRGAAIIPDDTAEDETHWGASVLGFLTTKEGVHLGTPRA